MSDQSPESGPDRADSDGPLSVSEEDLPEDLQASEDNPLAEPAGEDVPDDILKDTAGDGSDTGSGGGSEDASEGEATRSTRRPPRRPPNPNPTVPADPARLDRGRRSGS